MNLLRDIFWKTVVYNCHLVAKHLPGINNVKADYLSRLTGAVNFIPSFTVCCRGGTLQKISGLPGSGDPGTHVGTNHMAHQRLTMEKVP